MSTTLTEVTGTQNTVEINSFSSNEGQCLQLTQKATPKPGMQGHLPFDNVKMDEDQVRQAVAAMTDWLVERGMEAIQARK